ncbi:MAG: bifunctional hydroxymethylpyrimidine kinase/phosphomethylpyrimidine kinase [Vicinamibacterales bacterium]
MHPSLPVVLTIAGSDSGAGAGIQADLKTFAAMGVYGTSAITAITAQNTVGVSAAQVLPSDLVVAQIEAVASDFTIAATKTGMLGSAAVVEAVAAAIADLELPLVVVDPVMQAKGGDRLLDTDAVAALRQTLLPHALVVTPNIPEAEALTGITIRNLDDAKRAAERLRGHRGPAVVVKGGHAEGPEVVDLLFDGERFYEFRVPRIDSRNTHGTGCTFASAIAASLAHGRSLPDSTARAQAYVSDAIRCGLALGSGHGPLDHFWAMRRPHTG